MTGRRDSRIRGLIVELAESSPEAPTFAEIEDLAAEPVGEGQLRPLRYIRPEANRGWLVAAIAAVAVLVTIGGPVLLRTLGEDTEPAADETTSTTVVVPSTVPVDIESLIGPATIEGWGRVPHDDAVFGAEAAIHDVTGGGPGFVAVGHSGMSA
ncbi:MAG: hypothetical protein V3S26_00815, partial [Acidimicrobiia bacterium]